MWDPASQNWVEEIEAEVCTNVRFMIDIDNVGSSTCDLTNITVIDILPEHLEYVPGGISEWANYLEVSGNELTWNFSDALILQPGYHLYIDFYAHIPLSRRQRELR